jgi:hypothetical protein
MLFLINRQLFPDDAGVVQTLADAMMTPWLLIADLSPFAGT